MDIWSWIRFSWGGLNQPYRGCSHSETPVSNNNWCFLRPPVAWGNAIYLHIHLVVAMSPWGITHGNINQQVLVGSVSSPTNHHSQGENSAIKRGLLWNHNVVTLPKHVAWLKRLRTNHDHQIVKEFPGRWFSAHRSDQMIVNQGWSYPSCYITCQPQEPLEAIERQGSGCDMRQFDHDSTINEPILNQPSIDHESTINTKYLTGIGGDRRNSYLWFDRCMGNHDWYRVVLPWL